LTVDQLRFRRVMGNFATGVTVLTTALGDEVHGMTANAVCSVSLDPLLVLVCVEKTTRTHPVLSKSGVFALNVLSEEQEHLSRLFADDSVDAARRLAGLSYRSGATGAPILADCLAYVDCRVVETYPGGDHTIFVGSVEDLGAMREGRPLVFFRGGYGLDRRIRSNGGRRGQERSRLKAEGKAGIVDADGRTSRSQARRREAGRTDTLRPAGP
jgi:flavin reductase (DIM6/NTAB) family NADH-FMN oxidoreductase RutF